MKLLNVGLALSLLTASAVLAQGPMNDKIIVKMPYAMNVNGTVLQPGDYEIKQHDSVAGGSRILHFYSDKGMKFETTAMAIPALDNKTPEETSLVLDQYGSDYYLNKIWVQGKNYGYEFPIPASVKSREREMKASTVSARYENSSESASTQSVTKTETTETAQVTTPPPARVEAEPAPVAAAAPVEEPVTRPAPVEIAQNTPPPSPPAAVTPAPSMDERDTAPMPSTASNWLDFILVGTAFMGFGLMLRRSIA